jgi:hypothetical protein
MDEDVRNPIPPVFDKPAFSRFYQMVQTHNFGKPVKRQVCQQWGMSSGTRPFQMHATAKMMEDSTIDQACNPF